MLFKGTTSRSAEDIARSVDSIGGNLDAFTGKEMVCYNTKVLDEHLPIAMDVLSDLVRPGFAALKPAGPVPALETPATHARISLRSKKDLEQVHLCMGVPAFGIAHEDRFNCYVLNAVFSEIMPYADTGCLTVYAGTSLESAKNVVDCVVKEFRSLKEETVPAEELRRSKDHLKGSLMLGLESTSSRMSNLARQEMHFGRFFSLDELVEGIEKVTADDV